MQNLEWNLIEAFLRVAEEGSLSGAGRRLGVSQPTLSRQIRLLEDQLAVQLFVRHSRGLALTDKGLELRQVAQRLDENVQGFWRRATGLRADPEGVVRISAAEPVAIYVLGPALAELRQSHPRIRLEMVVDNSLANLSRREADLAIRMVRPTQPDLVARKLGEIPIGLFASRAYLHRYGEPQGPHDVEGHTLIGFDRDSYWHEAIRKMGLRPEHFALRTDAMAAQLAYACSGAGIATLHGQLGARHGLVQVLEGKVALPPLEVWLVLHEDQRSNPAMRIVSQVLSAALREYIDGTPTTEG